MDDLISRQAAIDAFDMPIFNIKGKENAERFVEYLRTVLQRIKELPSAQPEIIRCKDCAKRKYCRTSTAWAVAPDDDWYCGDAERRTDE